ncbi:hypothetical protein [Terasakiispira papahanaumokuakeensis]|nr:hypothetical protein [Terasakiispira papahanaumokuakeensis]
MSEHDENFRDTAGPVWILVGLVVLLAMPCLAGTIVWTQILTGNTIPY